MLYLRAKILKLQEIKLNITKSSDKIWTRLQQLGSKHLLGLCIYIFLYITYYAIHVNIYLVGPATYFQNKYKVLVTLIKPHNVILSSEKLFIHECVFILLNSTGCFI